MKTRVTRSIPEGAKQTHFPRFNSLLVEWTDAKSRPCARLYVGSRSKAKWSYYFSSIAEREACTAQWIESQTLEATRREELAAKAKKVQAQGHGLKAGDILYASWGWEQTNYDFYEVVTVSDKSVSIVLVEQTSANEGDFRHKVTPVRGAHVGEVQRKVPRFTPYGVCVPVGYGCAKGSDVDARIWDGSAKHATSYA